MGPVNDYERVARVIRHLDEHHTEQPGLDQLADLVGLSPSHFHRLFSRWAGVTPKDFVQCLTAEAAKLRLRRSESVLEVALGVGLSGPGRLHDLMVHLEAASPGEIKSRGKGLEVVWGLAATPFGYCSLGWTDRGVCHLEFRDRAEVDDASWTKLWEDAKIRRDDLAGQKLADRIFRRGSSGVGGLTAFVQGTDFQVRVWRALLRIPAGVLSSYGRIAQAIGLPGASRAVGTACGANPVAYLIPCHRVIRETGVVQGYRWGATRKQAMLAWEAAVLQCGR